MLQQAIVCSCKTLTLQLWAALCLAALVMTMLNCPKSMLSRCLEITSCPCNDEEHSLNGFTFFLCSN